MGSAEGSRIRLNKERPVPTEPLGREKVPTAAARQIPTAGLQGARLMVVGEVTWDQAWEDGYAPISRSRRHPGIGKDIKRSKE